jgi:hypothetical protein
MPVPARDTVLGDPSALWAMSSEAVRAPGAAGANRTETAHVAAGASVAPVHVSPGMTVKSPGLVPPMLSELMTRGAVPVFLTVTGPLSLVVPMTTEPKATDVGVTAARGATPLPDSAMETCGLVAELSGIEKVVDAGPVVGGANSNVS